MNRAAAVSAIPASPPGREPADLGHAARRQRRVWSARVDSWSGHGSLGLERVTRAVVEASDVRPGDDVLDLGCGTGQISLPLAVRGARVVAVDVSPEMTRRLREEASRRGVCGVDVVTLPIEALDLPRQSADLVVTSYALHHLRDGDKARVVARAFEWLRPGGRLVVADMMFGRGASRQDRAVLRSKVRALASKGPGGWWRIVKNGFRFALRIHERPISLQAWHELLARAGFHVESSRTLVSEAGLVVGRRPPG